MLNLLWISTSMFLSVIMGALALALLGVYLPDVLFVLFDWGDGLADWVYHLNINTQVMNVVRFLINGPQMVFLSLVIISRILISLIGMAFRRGY